MSCARDIGRRIKSVRGTAAITRKPDVGTGPRKQGLRPGRAKGEIMSYT
jgi:hypothetical protein